MKLIEVINLIKSSKEIVFINREKVFKNNEFVLEHKEIKKQPNFIKWHYKHLLEKEVGLLGTDNGHILIVLKGDE